MFLSKEEKKGCFYTEISPCLIVGEKGCIDFLRSMVKVLIEGWLYISFGKWANEVLVHLKGRYNSRE